MNKKAKIQAMVEQRLGDTVDDTRKKSIVASIEAAGFEDDTRILSIIDKLATRRQEKVLSYTAGMKDCNRCRKKMHSVKLHSGRPGYYCADCRIVMPKPVRN